MTKTLRTYYNILDVSPNASDEDVRKAYLALALKWHPDRNPGNRPTAQKKLQSVNHAYAQVRSKDQRERYNVFLLRYIQQQKKIQRLQKRQKQGAAIKQAAANANNVKSARPSKTIKNTKLAQTAQNIASQAAHILWPFVTDSKDQRHG